MRFAPQVTWFVALSLSFLTTPVQLCSGDDVAQKLPAASTEKIDFVKHIQPIFRAKCYSCHGAEEQEGGLRLDLSQRGLEGGDSGRAIVPRKIAESSLLLRSARLGDDEPMPPEDEGTPLTNEEVALLRAWIEQGAVWPESADPQVAQSSHWAFQPIGNPKIPEVKHKKWVRNGIDAFILRKLESEGIEPSPEADRATLIRRVYLDLIGLPPSVAEWDEAMNDTRQDWYEQLVAKLLRSPRYAERWGRRWLDVARYADSDGYEKDSQRPYAWRWRNWVIDSLNEDKPYDQFSIEQLAGDLLPNATIDQKVATGFNRNTLINREGGTDPEEDRVKRTVDRTNTLGTVWLGMTLGCAQCHTHKYDPVTQKEYYQLYAFFNSLSEPDIGAPLESDLKPYLKAKAAFDKEHQQYLDAINEYEKNQLPEVLKQWEKSHADSLPAPDWVLLKPESVGSKKGTTLEILEDRSVFASGEHPGRQEIYKLVFKTDLKKITGLRLETLTDERLPGNGPGRGPLGNFHVTRFDVTAEPLDGSAKPVKITLANPQASFSERGHGIDRAINSSPTSGWSVSPREGENHTATFETKKPIESESGIKLTITIWQSSVLRHFHGLGRFRVSATTLPASKEKPFRLHGLTDLSMKILATPAAKRTAEMQQKLLDDFRWIDPGYTKLLAAAREHEKKAPKNPYHTVKAQTVAELKTPRKTHFLIRGDFLTPDYEVHSNTPALFPPMKAEGDRPNRLDLARWLFDPNHPLTSRVTVNRIWTNYFGRGIVPTVDDFGTQGEPPSHPELLDWLARWFMTPIEQGGAGWHLKKLHTLIVTSATYRQSSKNRPELVERDPYNSWLSHQVRLRVEGEIVRDLALSVSGLIKHRYGGPSVRPPQPAGVAMLGYANSVKWNTSSGDDRYRRGIYTFFQRTVPFPMLMTFDSPDSNLTCLRRERSNTPLQALTLWNDPVFFECAQELGKRIITEAPVSENPEQTVDLRIKYLFQLCLARNPNEKELAITRQLYHSQKKFVHQSPSSAAQMVNDKKLTGAELEETATWVMIARTMINTDEFITRP